MADAWYDPDELAEMAEGDQTAVEFDPEATEDYDEIEGEDEAVRAALLTDNAAEVQAVIDTFTQPTSPVSGDDTITL